mmetsp:Transcript_9657/g.16035  ORF Transcript_9657/g.16035 Transcript_9657/m.16035 type:complete len:82 (+) Transcript_9657:1-246(+)
MPGMDVYTLDDRKFGRAGGRAVESHKDVVKYVQNLIKGRRTKAADDEKHVSMMKTIRTLSKRHLKKLQARLEKALATKDDE